MPFTINSTKDYHLNRLNSLGWELTICNALYPENTPIRKLLTHNDSYGHLLYDYLKKMLPMDRIRKIIEIGGGYGYLMKDFLDRNNSLMPCMLDISPFLIGKQKETLEQYDVLYKEEDFLETDFAFLTGFDLAILNENLGDFPAIVNVSKKELQTLSQTHNEQLLRASILIERYGLHISENESFNMNIGAIEALEKLCKAGVANIFLSEHSCEAQTPEHLHPFVQITSTVNPEKISLMGHDEYSLKFSDLEFVANAFGYDFKRGSFTDFIKFDMTEEIKIALVSRGRYKDEDEIICHFIEDLYKYEYLLLTKDSNLL
jgi:hypothetical protein